MNHEAWVDEAVCKEVPVETMFPEAGDELAIATGKLVCSSCAVVEPCLEFALSQKETDGIWGGKTAGERRTIARKRTRWHGST